MPPISFNIPQHLKVLHPQVSLTVRSERVLPILRIANMKIVCAVPLIRRENVRYASKNVMAQLVNEKKLVMGERKVKGKGAVKEYSLPTA